MSKYITMLRGINVGGQKKLRMAILREIYQSAGFWNIRTYLQSGNVVFETTEGNLSKLTSVIETLIQQTCGYQVEVFIRNPSEFKRILLNNPFLNDQNVEKNKLHVTFLYQIPSAAAWEKLIIPSGIPDEFEQGNQEIYLYCPNGYGRTKISNSFFERKLGVATTTRNWNTVQALYRLSGEGDSEPRGGK
jgi:uncharacterized protein (DUF1697 family)